MSAPDRIWSIETTEGPDPNRYVVWDIEKDGQPGEFEYLRATPARLHAEELAEALRKLKNEVAGLTAFEAEYREIGGNTNWHCLMQRMHEATAALAKLEKEEGK